MNAFEQAVATIRAWLASGGTIDELFEALDVSPVSPEAFYLEAFYLAVTT